MYLALEKILLVLGIILIIMSLSNLVLFKDFFFKGLDGPFAWPWMKWDHISSFASSCLVGLLCFKVKILNEAINIQLEKVSRTYKVLFLINLTLLAISTMFFIFTGIKDFPFISIRNLETALALSNFIQNKLSLFALALMGFHICNSNNPSRDSDDPTSTR